MSDQDIIDLIEHIQNIINNNDNIFLELISYKKTCIIPVSLLDKNKVWRDFQLFLIEKISDKMKRKCIKNRLSII